MATLYAGGRLFDGEKVQDGQAVLEEDGKIKRVASLYENQRTEPTELRRSTLRNFVLGLKTLSIPAREEKSSDWKKESGM